MRLKALKFHEVSPQLNKLINDAFDIFDIDGSGALNLGER